MVRKPKAFDTWKQMKPAALLRLAVAVFLMFSVLGPIEILMESELHLVSWKFVAIQTLASGGMAASIVFFGRKRWWIMILVVAFWTSVLTFNGGGLSLQFDENSNFRVRLNGPDNAKPLNVITQPLTLSPEQLDALYAQRGILGVGAILLLAFGYISFIKVVRAEVKDRSRLETEVNIAQDIQRSLVPDGGARESWCDIAGATIPATEVGGDYYDIIPLPDGRMAVAIADVTGHGVGAGILSAMTKSALRSQLQHDSSPVNVLANLNATLYEVSDEKMFVTFAYAVADPARRSIAVATAGHPPALLKRAATGDVEQLRTVSMGLGIQSGSAYSSLDNAFDRGDILLLYTDGLTEAMNKQQEQFGIERLQEFLRSSRSSPRETCSQLISELEKFAGAKTFQDDVSLVCIQFS